MKYLVLIAIVAGLLAGVSARAADDLAAYENGPVWNVTQVETIDGHFDEYMKVILTTWKGEQEGLKKAGLVTDYKVYLPFNHRKGEADVVLAVQYKNAAAALDQRVAESRALSTRIMGPIARQNQEQQSRSAIRTILSVAWVRELDIKMQ